MSPAEQVIDIQRSQWSEAVTSRIELQQVSDAIAAHDIGACPELKQGGNEPHDDVEEVEQLDSEESDVPDDWYQHRSQQQQQLQQPEQEQYEVQLEQQRQPEPRLQQSRAAAAAQEHRPHASQLRPPPAPSPQHQAAAAALSAPSAVAPEIAAILEENRCASLKNCHNCFVAHA
jgi:hypothetical protein